MAAGGRWPPWRRTPPAGLSSRAPSGRRGGAHPGPTRRESAALPQAAGAHAACPRGSVAGAGHAADRLPAPVGAGLRWMPGCQAILLPPASPPLAALGSWRRRSAAGSHPSPPAPARRPQPQPFHLCQHHHGAGGGGADAAGGLGRRQARGAGPGGGRHAGGRAAVPARLPAEAAPAQAWQQPTAQALPSPCTTLPHTAARRWPTTLRTRCRWGQPLRLLCTLPQPTGCLAGGGRRARGSAARQ